MSMMGNDLLTRSSVEMVKALKPFARVAKNQAKTEEV
jgi:hypothetical protein